MSKFVTTLSVDLDALLKNVPRGTHIHSATLSDDKKSVAVVWDNPVLVHRIGDGSEFPIENAISGELPDGVAVAEWARKPKTVTVETAPEPQTESVGVGNKEIVPATVKRKK